MPKKPYELDLPDTTKYQGRMPALHHFTSASGPRQALAQVLRKHNCLQNGDLYDELWLFYLGHPYMIRECGTTPKPGRKTYQRGDGQLPLF